LSQVFFTPPPADFPFDFDLPSLRFVQVDPWVP
jgi:hypothetical protein